MARSMLSLGIELSRAFWMAFARVAFDSGSGPPSLAATMIARASLENSCPRLASAAPFLRLMVAHLLCPDTEPLLGLPCRPAGVCPCAVDQPFVKPPIRRQLRMKAQAHQRSGADDDRVAVMGRMDTHILPDPHDHRRPDEYRLERPVAKPVNNQLGLKRRHLPAVAVAAHADVQATDERRITTDDVVGQSDQPSTRSQDRQICAARGAQGVD